MVNIRHELPQLDDGKPNIDAWLVSLEAIDGIEVARVRNAVQVFRSHRNFEIAIDLAQILVELELDTDSVIAGLTCIACQDSDMDLSTIEKRFGSGVGGIVRAVFKTTSTGVLNLSTSPMLAAEAQDQVDNVRAMLVALIDDPRVAVIILAERVVALRVAKHAAVDVRERVAAEALRVFAPLAGRLGIWQLKWGLEDLAFRYLHPDEYMTIAAQLDGKRQERERQVVEIVDELGAKLARAGVAVQVQGRAKHIYGIWRKMREKHIDFTHVYDVQAVRVLVEKVSDCYATLGIVHTSWPHIPSEFDDYIANPKDNGYRSIHTAVIGPTGKMLEVQVRTYEMHREAELGVCAHWAYKGEEGDALSSEKMQWMRQVLEWHEELGDLSDYGSQHTQSRIYVSTPDGHVLDLTADATPVDFAYRVHTEIGHRCRGAIVDGSEVPLNVPLRTGQSVEIVTAPEQAPRREWLNTSLGYVRSARARAKIQAWFRGQVAESNIAAGRALLADTFERLEMPLNITDLAEQAGFESADELLLAVGLGDQHVIELVRLASAGPRISEQLSLLPLEKSTAVPGIQSILIQGDDRPGLLRDITEVLASLSLSVVGTTGRADVPGQSATISLDLGVANLLELAQAIDLIRRIPNVRDVRRI